VATKKCPVCGVSVKIENLERHVRDQHPRAEIDPGQLLTEGERATIKAVGPPRTTVRPSLTMRGKVIIGVAAIVILLVLAVIIVNPFRTGLRPGQEAPDFSLVASDGSPVSLLALRGQPVLLEFIDIDCPHCINEAPVLVSLYSSHSTTVHFLSLDVNFNSLPPDDTVQRIDSFKSTQNTPWPYALAEALVPTYQVSATPTMFILTANGIILQVYTGETPLGTLSSALDQALRG